MSARHHERNGKFGSAIGWTGCDAAGFLGVSARPMLRVRDLLACTSSSVLLLFLTSCPDAAQTLYVFLSILMYILMHGVVHLLS
jgi:hypothetical protein